MKPLSIIGGALLVFAVAYYSMRPATADSKSVANVLTAIQLQDSRLPVLIDFSATWCGPCQELAPIIDELSEEYQGRVSVVKIDVDQQPELSGELNVSSIPALFFIKDGKVQHSRVGLQSKESISALLDQML